ncbi:hypothetical protein WMY93_017396 [Mugilogobius chulae]|uniref:Cilia- and flagella-associated protein 43 n=1 Tax=Mugilogobius chulae TaxID=88201 RepID=A0AAW0P084_9GOBI
MDFSAYAKVRWIRGFTNKEVYFVDKNTIAYPCGNYINFLDLNTTNQSILQCPGSGVSAFTANGNSGVFAFSPCALNPSIFVHHHPTLELKKELAGLSKVDYISLALSDNGPYLVSCSSLPDFTITVWNWENATPLCQHEYAGMIHIFYPVELPDVDGAMAKKFVLSSHSVSEELCYFGPEMPPSAIAGLKGKKTEDIVNKLFTKARATPVAICWTTSSQLYVGCKEGFLLLVDPELLSVSTLFSPKTPSNVPELKHSFQSLALHKDHLIAVGKGQLFTLNKSLSENVTKVLDMSCGDFVALSFSPTDKNICLTVREPGQLQVWSTDGLILGSISVQTKITSLACCPIANYVVLGTTCGNVLFIDVRDPQQPRIVHQTHLYHTSVEHLVASDSYLYVLDPKPSSKFAVLGYTALSLSAQYVNKSDKVKVLALCDDSDKNHSRSLTLLSLHAENLTDIPDSVERNGCLSNNVLNVFKYKVPHPLTSCVLGNKEIFAYCRQKKSLQCFDLPQRPDSADSKQAFPLNPKHEVKSHTEGPASLALSPHKLWLASLSRDGVLQVRECASMDTCVELQCHARCFTGVQLVSFSADSQTILTANTKDGSLVCTNLRMSEAAVHQATEYSKTLEDHLRRKVRDQNFTLGKMLEWNEKESGSLPSTDKNDKAHETWLENRRKEIVKEDYEKCSGKRANIEKELDELFVTIKDMMSKNKDVPESKLLEQKEFDLDVDHYKIQEAIGEEEALKARAEIEWDILAKSYKCDVLKKERWDALKVKGRSVMAFHSDHEVKNYPLKERTKLELDDLRRVEEMGKIEKAQCTNREQESQRVHIKSSVSYVFGYSSLYIYDQFEVRTREQIINQIIMLQDVIYQIMTELDLQEQIWEPSLTVAEQPEKLLTVQDSEITAEKYLTPEQKEEQEKKKLEKKSRLASKEDDAREMALDNMMDGVLEVKKEDILKLSEWSEEEKKMHKTTRRRLKKTAVCHKRNDGKFDETLAKLFKRKMESEMAVNQEQLKITYLLQNLLIEEEMRNREAELKLKLEQVLTHKEDKAEEVAKCENEVEQFRMIYDTKVAEDKDLDREFRKEFSDVPNHFVDELSKLFKRRPRVQKMRAQTTKAPSLSKTRLYVALWLRTVSRNC